MQLTVAQSVIGEDDKMMQGESIMYHLYYVAGPITLLALSIWGHGANAMALGDWI